MGELQLAEASHPGALVLALTGWVDISNVAGLLERIERAAGAGEVRRVAIDFAATEYIDSAAVSTLIQSKSILEDAGKSFHLCGLSEQVKRVLEETRLIELFPVYPDVAAFLATPDEPAPKG